MEVKELLKRIATNCFFITGGCTMCATIFCSIFYPDYSFTVKGLGAIIMMGVFCSLTILLLWSPRELSKKSLIVREIIQCIFVFLIIFFISYYNDWINRGSIKEPLVMFCLVTTFYVIVCVFNLNREKKIAKSLNERLKKFQSN